MPGIEAVEGWIADFALAGTLLCQCPSSYLVGSDAGVSRGLPEVMVSWMPSAEPCQTNLSKGTDKWVGVGGVL